MRVSISILSFAPMCALFVGCATVSSPPQERESVASGAEQRAAQTATSLPAKKRYKLKVSVARFTNETNYGRSLLTDQELDRIGKQASDMLASRLILSGRFIVLERSDLGKLRAEQEITKTTGLVGSDTLILGSVTEFGRSVSGKVGFLSSTKMQTARAKVDIRLVDAKSGHAYFPAIGAGEASTEAGEIAGYGSRAEYDATLNDRAISAAISNVVDRLISRLADRPWRTDVLKVEGKRIFISGGKRQGVQPGDELAVLEEGESVKGRQSGFQVSLPPKELGHIKVVSVFGDSDTNEGAVCELISGQVPPKSIDRVYVAEAKSEADR